MCWGWSCVLQGVPLILVGQRGDGDGGDGITSLQHTRRIKANRSSNRVDHLTSEQHGAQDERRDHVPSLVRLCLAR